jgi:predicted glycosyltransferase
MVGIGHLTASLQVIRELLTHSDVDLIYSGHQIDINLQHPGFRTIILPTILINEKTGELYDPSSSQPIEQLWSERWDSIQQFLKHDYNAIIVEFFPFGRRRFKKEILRLFQTVQDTSGNIPVFCFVREVLVPESKESEQRMVQLVNNNIHTIFVRGDPKIIAFDETFSLTPQIANKLIYIGYLGSSLPAQASLQNKQYWSDRVVAASVKSFWKQRSAPPRSFWSIAF